MDLTLIDRNTNRELPDPYEIRILGWTEERYWTDAPADRYCEFVDGEVIMPSPVDIEHQRTVGLLSFLLHGFCTARGAGEVLTGPTAVRLRPGLAREPDLFVLSRADSAAAIGSRIEACPLLVIEIAGEDSERRDLSEKPTEYATRGIGEYWVVMLRTREVVVHRPGAAPVTHATGRVQSSGLPGFWVEVDWLRRPGAMNGIDCLKQILGAATL